MDATAGEAFARPRSRVRGLDATTRLEHFALVTFAVDPIGLAAVLPAGLEPEIRRLRPRLGQARRARYAVFERLGLVQLDATPHSVLLQRSIDFDVLLPPRSA